MSHFDFISRLSKFESPRPFPKIRSLAWRVSRLLSGQTSTSLEHAAEWIEKCVQQYKEEKVAEDRERAIRSLEVEGGWELAYWLRFGDRGPPSEKELRELLDFWPAEAGAGPDVLDVEDISDPDALADLLDNGGPDAALPDFADSQLFAVMAMMKLNTAVWELQVKEKFSERGVRIYRSHPWPVEKVIAGANSLLEAAELISWAERGVSDELWKQQRVEERAQLQAEISARAQQENARRGGVAKAEKSRSAKDFVLREWHEHRDAYGNNKSAFARDYVRRVKNELNVTVTEKTMREDWLRNARPAGTPAP